MKKFILLNIFVLILLKNLYALEIVVSNSPLEKIVKEIAREYRIYQLQSERKDFHFYEPTLYQWQRIKNAELVVIVGTESWAKKVYEVRKGKITMSLVKGEVRFKDPHLWFDLKRVGVLVTDLRDFLSRKDPSRKGIYQKRSEKFLKSLEKIEEDYEKLKACKNKEIYILGHPVFEYLLKNSGITQVTLLKGYHKEGEPSVKTLTEMIKKIKEKKEKIIFLTDPEFERYKSFFEQEGIKVIKLWSGGTYYMPGGYVELLRYNLENIKKALNCE